MLARAVFLLLLFVLPGNAVYYPANWLPRDAAEQQRAPPTKVPGKPVKATYIPWLEPAPYVDFANKSNRAYYGVAHLRTEKSGCTAVLIRGDPEKKAVLLLAGHCIDKALMYNAGAVFKKFHDAPNRTIISVGVEKKLWGMVSMYDLGVVQLNVTYGFLASKGIIGYKIAERTIYPGEPVHYVGVPTKGLDESQKFLRRADCFVRGASVRMAEGSWIWQSMRRFDCAGIIGGLSGAPLFNAKQEVTGLIITTTIGGVSYRGPACYDDNPCELLPTGYISRFNASYTMDLKPLILCFINGTFSPNFTGCPLREPAILLPDRVLVRKLGGFWRVTPTNVSAGVSMISWKAGRLELTDCTAPGGYRPPIRANESFQTSVGYKERRWVACAAPVVKGKLQLDRANFAMMKVDRTPPVTPPKLSAEPDGEGGYMIQPIFEVPELVDYYWKIGPTAFTDCNKRADYNRFLKVAQFLYKEDMPITVCLMAADDAGYWTAPKAFHLPK